MIRKYLILSFFIACSNLCFAQSSIHPVAILGGKVNLQLPAALPAFQKDPLRLLWKTAHPVTEIAVINGGETFLEYAYTDRVIDDNNIPAFTDELLATFPKEKKYTRIVDDGIFLKEGKNIGYLKAIIKEKGDHLFHYFFYMSFNDQLLLFHFATPANKRRSWDASIDAAAQSIKLSGRALAGIITKRF